MIDILAIVFEKVPEDMSDKTEKILSPRRGNVDFVQH